MGGQVTRGAPHGKGQGGQEPEMAGWGARVEGEGSRHGWGVGVWGGRIWRGGGWWSCHLVSPLHPWLHPSSGFSALWCHAGRVWDGRGAELAAFGLS